MKLQIPQENPGTEGGSSPSGLKSHNSGMTCSLLKNNHICSQHNQKSENEQQGVMVLRLDGITLWISRQRLAVIDELKATTEQM